MRVLICAVAMSGLLLAQSPKPHTTWSDYGGGADASQYSALNQINRTNVSKLKVAWSYPIGDGNLYLFNPVVVDGVMYVMGKGNSIVALNAATGREIWSHANGAGAITTRGLNYWQSADGKERRLVYANANYLVELDARTGMAVPAFGNDGRVDLAGRVGGGRWRGCRCSR